MLRPHLLLRDPQAPISCSSTGNASKKMVAGRPQLPKEVCGNVTLAEASIHDGERDEYL